MPLIVAGLVSTPPVLSLMPEGVRNICSKEIVSFTLFFEFVRNVKSDQNIVSDMKIWFTRFLAVLLALTIMSALVAPHGANADPQKAGTDKGSSFQIASALTSGHHGSDTKATDACLAMSGHCATVLCGPHDLGHPKAVTVDIHRITFKAQFYSVFSSVDLPPPRA